jgi:hypothetical protein
MVLRNGGSAFRTVGRGRLLNADELAARGKFGKGSLAKVKYARETIATFHRYSSIALGEIRKLIHRVEAQIISGAKSSVTVDDATLQKSIRRRRKRPDQDFGERVVQGGVTAYAAHGVVEEAGAFGGSRPARPFFYRQLDTAGPRFDRGVEEIITRTAIRKAGPRTRV